MLLLNGYFSMLLLAGVALVACSRIVIRAAVSPLRKLPGPWYSIFTPYILKYYVVKGERIYYVHGLHQKYGEIVRLGPEEISIASLTGFKQVYAVNSEFTKHEWYLKFSGHPNKGLFTMTDRKEHSQRRRMFSKAFSKTQIRLQWEKEIQPITKKAVGKIKDNLRENGKADILKWWTFMASDISGQLMFGESWDMLGKGKKNEFIRSLETFTQGSALAAELPILKPIGRLIPHPWFQRAFRGWDLVIEYASRAVDNSKQRIDLGAKTIFGDILALAEKNESLSEFDIKNEAGNFTVAGTDTSAVTLTYLVYAVLSRPKLQRALEAEAATLADDFTDTDVEKLVLLNATIDETNRLFAVAQGAFPRRAPVSGAVVDGYMVPHRTTISAQPYTMHRSENPFPDALEFKPERWLPSPSGGNTSVSSNAKAVYVPFGSGSRICIGIHVALMEIRLAAATFFRDCSPGVTLAEDTTAESMSFLNYFATFPRSHRCNVKLVETPR